MDETLYIHISQKLAAHGPWPGRGQGVTPQIYSKKQRAVLQGTGNSESPEVTITAARGMGAHPVNGVWLTGISIYSSLSLSKYYLVLLLFQVSIFTSIFDFHPRTTKMSSNQSKDDQENRTEATRGIELDQ